MSGPADYSGGRSELDALRDYDTGTLRKPQVVADAALQTLFLADYGHRPALATLVVQEMVEAARHLAAVWIALSDRSRPVGRRLLGPLPRADDWAAFVAAVDGVAPDQLRRALGLDESVLEALEELSAMPALGWYEPLVRAFEAGPPSWLTAPAVEAARRPISLQVVGRGVDGTPTEVSLALTEDDIVALGDATADFTRLARELLSAYVALRQETIDRSGAD